MLATLVQMPPAPAPSEELASILGLNGRQRVDLTALIIDMSVPRRETTPYGQKDIVDRWFHEGQRGTAGVRKDIYVFPSERDGRGVA